MRTITAGKLKDAGSPFREMSPDERAYFQAMLDDVHEQFIGAVAESRKLPRPRCGRSPTAGSSPGGRPRS